MGLVHEISAHKEPFKSWYTSDKWTELILAGFNALADVPDRTYWDFPSTIVILWNHINLI